MRVSRRFWLGMAGAVACLWGCTGTATAVEGLGRTTRNSSGDHRPLKYFVLQVMGVTGDVTFEVCGDIEYRKRQRDYKEEYEKAGQEWLKNKADARKSKTEFKEDPPKGPKLMRKMEGSFKKEEEARAAADKFQKQLEELKEKREAKKEGAAKESGGEKKAE